MDKERLAAETVLRLVEAAVGTGELEPVHLASARRAWRTFEEHGDFQWFTREILTLVIDARLRLSDRERPD